MLPLLVLVVGCRNEPYKVAHVSGRVTLDGQPVPNAAIVFSPVATKDNNEPGPDSGARTDADGRFTLTLTGTSRAGAVVGKHKVRITLIQDSNSSDDLPKQYKKLPGKFSGKNTILEFDVPASGTSAADFKLNSE
jgi:hypothetical protein